MEFIRVVILMGVQIFRPNKTDRPLRKLQRTTPSFVLFVIFIAGNLTRIRQAPTVAGGYVVPLELYMQSSVQSVVLKELSLLTFRFIR